MLMLYFLFLINVGEAFPYVLKLVTNMGTVGRYRSIDANTNIKSGMCVLEEIIRQLIISISEMTC